jgi:hypothetical protein
VWDAPHVLGDGVGGELGGFASVGWEWECGMPLMYLAMALVVSWRGGRRGSGSGWGTTPDAFGDGVGGEWGRGWYNGSEGIDSWDLFL